MNQDDKDTFDFQFEDAKKWTLIHNGMPLVSIISMEGDEWERKV